jgi:hypothetical protein
MNVRRCIISDKNIRFPEKEVIYLYAVVNVVAYALCNYFFLRISIYNFIEMYREIKLHRFDVPKRNYLRPNFVNEKNRNC